MSLFTSWKNPRNSDALWGSTTLKNGGITYSEYAAMENPLEKWQVAQAAYKTLLGQGKKFQAKRWAADIRQLSPAARAVQIQQSGPDAEELAEQYGLNNPQQIKALAARRARMAANEREGYLTTMLGSAATQTKTLLGL